MFSLGTRKFVARNYSAYLADAGNAGVLQGGPCVSLMMVSSFRSVITGCEKTDRQTDTHTHTQTNTHTHTHTHKQPNKHTHIYIYTQTQHTHTHRHTNIFL